MQSCARIGFIHGLDWIGLDWVTILKNVCGLDWTGSKAPKIIFEQLNCVIALLSIEEDKSCCLHTYSSQSTEVHCSDGALKLDWRRHLTVLPTLIVLSLMMTVNLTNVMHMYFWYIWFCYIWFYYSTAVPCWTPSVIKCCARRWF